MATRIPIPTIGPAGGSVPTGGGPYLSGGVPVSNAVGAGLQDLGAAITGIAQEDARAWASKAASDDQLKWMQKLEEMKGQAGPGAPDFSQGVLTSFDDYANQARAAAPAYAKRFYDMELNRLRDYVGRNSLGWQAQQHRANTVDQYQSGLQADAVSISLDPTLYDEKRAARMAILSESNLPPDVRNDLLSRSEAEMATAAGAARIDQDPKGALNAFGAAATGKIEPGYEWIARLNADRVQQLRTRAQTQSDRQDNRMRIEQDRAFAMGERALKEMDNQLTSPYPARPSDVMRWGSMVAGSPFENSYRERVEELNAFQELMQRPVGEQVGFVEGVRRKLMTEGGTPQDAARAERLSATVQANIKALSTAPVEWAANRTGEMVQPLALDAIGTEDGAAIIGAQVRARADVVRGLQAANPPGMVRMHPLLPGEAEGLSRVLSQGSAQQKRQVLSTLYQAAGADDTYRGMMDQLKGVSPFAARMGVLAASYDSAKTTNNWFSEDTVQAAGDVAAIALHGDEILRSGGKDNETKWPVPKEQEFVAAFQDRFQNLYRGGGPGESGAQQFQQDMQAVKAYYVGRAAQDGDLSSEIDSNRLDQAFRAVMGEPVDFHGNGQVLAPWGMNKEDFQRRANNAVLEQFQQAGIQDKVGRYMGNVGLIGVGGGMYFATLAGQPVADDRGQPITILLTPDSASARDSYGRLLSRQIPTTEATQ
ncbi:hypothetical protein [Achromobacter spanius]|uniref:Uncharacterized protein n=1 Tax=Achromobacter spanius TaxID=217203 RepID=A0AAW3I6C3_9BURK|nr:hypothetical protein [Achromobacter spanius]KNE28167.1 hypothetical protein AFM18_08355 [Achromobacter spanius]